MFNNYEQQSCLYWQDVKANNKRITRDGLRLFLIMTGSDFKRAEHLKANDLSSYAQIPKFKLDDWLSNAYHESTRPM